MNFYSKFYKQGYDIAVRNSSHVCCYLKNGVIVGACRIITDYHAHTSIVDLVVDKKERRTGVGKKIIESAIKCTKELNTSLTSLTTDPQHPWLKDFYKELGFVERKNHFVLVYPKKS